MALIACPKCSTNLRVPDGSVAAVRCPKCKTIFTPPKPAAAFEVVEASPPPPKPVVRTPAKPIPPPAPPPADFDVIDDEPERPRKRRPRDDDYDDDDFEDDRPRGRGRKRRDDYDPSGGGSPFSRGKLACLLLSISIWLYLGGLGTMAFFATLAWAGANLSPGLMVLPGLAGASNWVVALVGLGFAIAGPRQAKGLAIAATIVSGIHFVVVVVCFTNLQDSRGGLGMIGMGLGGFEWVAVVSLIPAVDGLLPGLIYGSSSIGSDFIFAVLGGGLEIARLILILLLLKACGKAARDRGAQERAGVGVVVVSVVCGAVALVVTLVVVILYEGKLVSTAQTLLPLTVVLGYTAYACMLIVPGMAALETKDALDRR